MAAADLVTDSSWNIYYYSPAICPSGWTEATTFSSLSQANPSSVWFSIESNTNVALCCPSEYNYFSGLGHQCTSQITQNQIVQYVFATFNGASGYDRGTVSTSTFASDATAWGDGVPIWWQNSDDALLAAASTMLPSASSSTVPTTGLASTGGTARPSATTSIPSSTAATSASSTAVPGVGGLSTGAKVGLGVGIPVAIIAGLALGYLLFRRRQGRGTPYGGATDVQLGKYRHNAPPGPYYDGQQPPNQPTHEIYSQPEPYHSMHELPSTTQQRSGDVGFQYR
ncbi:hypothetical protein BU16DRAFT_531503 [Lophium mytilinum]|uniref:Mid2 domain-containing protein n=1 Tax=Lophium mytilinum TaxID=390894 RepID=A0A6A6QBS8_9PEZI|nr:hypothetical protein BU16DRAFT_531503 [Lophium mytilinum]